MIKKTSAEQIWKFGIVRIPILSVASILTVAFMIVSLTACGGNGNKSDAYGTFEVDEVTVSSKGTGELLNYSLEEGMKIPADTIIGVADTTDLHLQRQEIAASLMSANAQRITTEAQIHVTERESEQLERDKNRINAMYEQKAATQKQLEDIQTAYDLSKKKLDVLKAQFPAIDAQIATIKAKAALLDQRIHDASIVNPVSGVVLTKFVEEHELLAPGKPLYAIADMKYLYLKAFVSGPQLTQIQLGQNVKVFTDVSENEMKEHPGVITWISSKAEFTPKSVQTRDERTALVYAIKVRVENKGDLQIGMPGEVRWR